MKRAAYSIVHIIAWCALVYAWLIRGYEGAGNVATVLIWLLLFASLFANTQASIRNSAKHGKTLLGGAVLVVKAMLSAAIIWHGHIATGVAMLVATTLFAVARQEAGILGSQRYSGVLAAVTLLSNGSSPEGLMSELLAYGRQIGRN